MNAEQLMHGEDWHGPDVTGWWITEKLDGCRALWTGKEFVTRTGRAINAPDWFTAGLPAFPLDGEIHAGRGNFTAARLAVQCGQFTPAVAFAAFDAPEVASSQAMRQMVAGEALAGCQYARAVDGYTAASMAEVWQDLDLVKSLGGEGLMACKPGTKYVNGRTRTLLKLKSRP